MEQLHLAKNNSQTENIAREMGCEHSSDILFVYAAYSLYVFIDAARKLTFVSFLLICAIRKLLTLIISHILLIKENKMK